MFALHFHSRDAVPKAGVMHSFWQAPEGIDFALGALETVAGAEEERLDPRLGMRRGR